MENNSILIDQYLQNEMNAEERAAFERRLATDKELQTEFSIQQRIINAATTMGVKAEFSKAIRKKVITRRLIQWGIVVVIAVAAFVFYAIKNDLFSHSRTTTKEATINKEVFDITNDADTIIETKDGMVFAIPAHAFKSTGERTRLEIKTALNAYDILHNGLSTMSNDRLLRTAGMFYINGFENDIPVSLQKDIAVSIPTDKIDPAMQLFDGVEDTSGHVNWINPKPIENKLRTYDITTLDFYPPRYIPALKALQKNYTDKKYTDSLYYSFSNFRWTSNEVINTKVQDTTAASINVEQPIGVDYVIAKDTAITPRADSIRPVDDFYTSHMELDPAKIGAIWDKKFNNTILATKEFEERLRFMHSLCTDIYLEGYVRGLNKPLYQIDQLCADNSSGETKKKFLEFAARKDGSVSIATSLQQELSEYFQKKYTAYKEAAAKTWAKHEAELMKLDSIADKKRREQVTSDRMRNDKSFQEEFCINLTDAYRQVGIQRSCKDTVVPPSTKYYNVTISTPGWKNLDVYVFDATLSRQSMTYTDTSTGKTATLTYKEITVQIEGQEQYDRVLVYLIPDSISSFQRIKQEGNLFRENLNSLFKYDIVVIGYKGTDAFMYRQQNIQPGAYTFRLSPATNEDLRSISLDYPLSKAKDIEAEFDYQLFEQQEAIRNLQLRKDLQFRQQVAMAIFACGDEGGVSIK